MGTRRNHAGLVVQFYDAAGDAVGPALHGPYVEIFGRDRDAITGGQMSQEERAEPGSQDWMTFVAVADTKERMDALLGTWSGDTRIPNTSAASRRVQVEVHVGNTRETASGVITIANGKIDKEAMTMEVMLIKVLDPDTVMNEDHKLHEEYRRMGPFFQ